MYIYIYIYIYDLHSLMHTCLREREQQRAERPQRIVSGILPWTFSGIFPVWCAMQSTEFLSMSDISTHWQNDHFLILSSSVFSTVQCTLSQLLAFRKVRKSRGESKFKVMKCSSSVDVNMISKPSTFCGNI